MEYIISLLEGIITFISPCLLPMLPMYLSYFAGQSTEESSMKKTVKNACGFVCGFTVIFLLLGILAGTFGNFVRQYTDLLNIIFGIIVILFGLNFMEILKIPFLNATKKINWKPKELGFFSAFLFGIIFSIGWTPCIGTFLGSALILVSLQGEIVKGSLMLLCYSLGLGIPFIISAIFIQKLKNSFQWIKQHYAIIQKVAGILLIIMGILMITGWLPMLLRNMI